MKHLFFMVLFIPLLSQAHWMKSSKPAVPCKGELFIGSAVKAVVWNHGNDLISVCAFEKTESANRIKAKDSFEVKAKLSGVETVIASEGEVGPDPVQIEFVDDVVRVKRYLGWGGPVVYSQEISCDSKCEISKEKCELKTNSKAKAIMDKIDGETIEARDDKKKLKLWQKYFYDGSRFQDGQIVVAEAMMGDNRAEKLALNAPGADGGSAEIVGEERLKIERIQKICATAAPQ